MEKKRGRWRRPKGGTKKPSFVKIGIQQKVKEARCSARIGTTCNCKDDQACTHGDPIWLGRAEKLEALRGEMAVSVFNYRSKPNFWDAIDALKAPTPKTKKPSAPKSTAGVSLKNVLRKLQQKAKEKSVSGKCDCPPWGDCSHLDGNLREMWCTRLEKLQRVSVQGAQPLLPHVGTTGIWDAVDRLDLADQAGAAEPTVMSPPASPPEPPPPVAEQTDRGFVW